MKLNLECISCNINQVIKITEILEINPIKREQIMREVLKYLHTASYNQSNPELIKGTWDIIIESINNKNPYKSIKEKYNSLLLTIENKIEKSIGTSNNELLKAIKISTIGNIIDFASNHNFDEDIIMKRIENIDNEIISKDHSSKLIELLLNSKTLLFIGDNCGEIVLDKILLRTIKKYNPNIDIFYGVRGTPILNDVTTEDAKDVKIDDYAQIISNEDGSLGTVINKVGGQFKKIFNESDVVISKGQGNFESLSDVSKKNLFFMFLVKCKAVGRIIGTDTNQIICAQK